MYVESDARTPHQNQWVQICLEIAQSKKDPSLQKYFWVTLANRMKNAQQFQFGEVEDTRIKEEALRAGPLIAEELLSLPYPSVVYNYTLKPDPEDVPKEMWDQRVKFCTLAAVVPKHKMIEPLPGPLIFAADFCFADPNDSKFDVRFTRKYLMTLVAGVAFQANPDEGKWQGEVIDKPDVGGLFNQLVCVADGVASLSMILATKGIPTELREPTDKRQRQRVKKKKSLLPSVTHVDTQRYYAAMSNVGKGHHASPVPHLRRGHIRRLASGKNTWVRDAIVNCRTLSDVAGRDHYEVE